MDRLIGIWALIFVRPMLVLGALVAAIGIALMLFAGGYFAVGAYSESGLDDLTVTQEESGLTQEVLTRGLATPETTPMPTSTVIPTVVATTGPAAVALASTPESTAPSTTAEADQQETIGTPADEGASENTESAEDSPYDEYGILRTTATTLPRRTQRRYPRESTMASKLWATCFSRMAGSPAPRTSSYRLSTWNPRS